MDKNDQKEEKRRLNFVCVDECKSCEIGFKWYVHNYHRPDDIIGIVHVHHIPSLPTMGLMGGGAVITDEYKKRIERAVHIAHGEFTRIYCNSTVAGLSDLSETALYRWS